MYVIVLHAVKVSVSNFKLEKSENLDNAFCVFFVFTARCTFVQTAVLPSHVVCLSVTLVDCDHIGWNSSKIISPLVSLGCSLFATPT